MKSEMEQARAEWLRRKEARVPTECRRCKEIEPCSERGLCDRCEHTYLIAEMDDGE